MRTIYFEDGSREYIINPRFDFRRVIEDRLGKDSADFFDEIIEEVEFETQTHADSILNDIALDIKRAIRDAKIEGDSFQTVDFLQNLYEKFKSIYDV